jgi:DUF971 family protein
MTTKLEAAALIGNELAVVFSDGREVYLPLPLLRRACPCAGCQGEPDALGRVLRPTVNLGPKAFGLLKFEVVGGYGLQPYWADGHSTGIYSYDYLRRLGALPSS